MKPLLAALFVAAALLARDRIEFELGYAYEYGDFHGLAFPRDLAQAATWLRHAADAGNPRAQYLLGLDYSRGFGLSQDDTAALYWFNRSAAQLYGPACFHLAWMLHKGDGVARDEARAQWLMAQAAARGMKSASLHKLGQGAVP